MVPMGDQNWEPPIWTGTLMVGAAQVKGIGEQGFPAAKRLAFWADPGLQNAGTSTFKEV